MRVEALDGDAAALKTRVVPDREEDRAAARDELRPAMAQLPGFELGDRLARPAAGGHLEHPLPVARHEQDGVVRPPGFTADVRGVGHRDDGAALQADLLEFLVPRTPPTGRQAKRTGSPRRWCPAAASRPCDRGRARKAARADQRWREDHRLAIGRHRDRRPRPRKMVAADGSGSATCAGREAGGASGARVATQAAPPAASVMTPARAHGKAVPCGRGAAAIAGAVITTLEPDDAPAITLSISTAASPMSRRRRAGVLAQAAAQQIDEPRRRRRGQLRPVGFAREDRRD